MPLAGESFDSLDSATSSYLTQKDSFRKRARLNKIVTIQKEHDGSEVRKVPTRKKRKLPTAEKEQEDSTSIACASAKADRDDTKESNPAFVTDAQKGKEKCSSSGVTGASETSDSALNEKDVLSGRGGGTNLHPGNRFYRDLILSRRAAYDEASKTMKPEIAREIVHRIRERGGRFLRRDCKGQYHEIDDREAKAKTSQALRHRTFELRNSKDPERVKMNGRWKHGVAERTNVSISMIVHQDVVSN